MSLESEETNSGESQSAPAELEAPAYIKAGYSAVPSPTGFDAEVCADGLRYIEMLGAGELDTYEGQCVAIVNGKVVGTGDDPLELERRVCRELGLPEGRPVIRSLSKSLI